jgi:hypothetical protein
MLRDELTLTAVHEASHTVVGLRLGCVLVEVTLDPPLTAFAAAPRPSAGIFCVRALAGSAGEWLFTGRGGGDDVDVAQVRRRLGIAYTANIAGLRWSARSLVRAHRDDIATVAEALLRHQALSGPEVCDMLAAAVLIKKSVRNRESAKFSFEFKSGNF